MAKVRRIDKRQPADWREALDEFITLKRAQSLSATTIYDYTKHISQFFRRFPDAYPNDLKRCTLDYLSDEIAPATYNIRRAYLKNFFGFLVVEGHLTENPLNGIKKRHDEGRIRNVGEDVLIHLLKLPDQGTFAGLRDYCLLLLTMDTGIRPGEALSLTPGDIDLEAGTVAVRREVSKTRRLRVLPLSGATIKAIRRLLATRHADWGENAPALCSWEGKRLYPTSWYHRLDTYGKRLGVKISPYDLRHSFALMYLQNGGHAFALQHTLGHTSMEMTRRYVNMSSTDLAEAHRTASPLNKLLDGGRRVRKL